MTNSERIAWFAFGLIAGANILGLVHSTSATAQNPNAVWQLALSSDIDSIAWRLNTVTGVLQACKAGQKCIPVPSPPQ